MKNSQQRPLNAVSPSTLSLTGDEVCTHLHHSSEKSYLQCLLLDLDGVQQNPRYHPEVDALYHSLQVFQQVSAISHDPVLMAAALFHDVGKSVDMKYHALIGAQMLQGIFIEPVVWLIAHHLDLLTQPKRTRRKLRNSIALNQLELLRRCDLQGRKVNVDVLSVSEAIEQTSQADEIFQQKT